MGVELNGSGRVRVCLEERDVGGPARGEAATTHSSSSACTLRRGNRGRDPARRQRVRVRTQQTPMHVYFGRYSSFPSLLF